MVGSCLLMCGAAAVISGAAADAPAAPNGREGVAAETAGAEASHPEDKGAERLVRVASADSSSIRSPAVATPSARALRRTVDLLSDGLKRLDTVPAYTAAFEKREAVDGVLLDPQRMEMTLRHEPFGVHLAWVEGQRGRTLLYETGRNDGQMLVNPGGWRGRLTGTVRLDPEGTLAKREARHPVTNLGLRRLATKLLDYRRAELASAGEVTCTLSDGHTHDGRPVWKNVLEYRTPGAGGEFRRSVALIDREWNLPVRLEVYGWPTPDVPPAQVDARTLIGRYSYTAVDFKRYDKTHDVSDLTALTGFRVK